MPSPGFALHVLMIGISCGAIQSEAFAGPQADTLFPEETVGYIAITNAPDFHTRWKKTQIGKLSVDPAMKPFVDSLRNQFNDRVGRLDEKLGVTIDDLADLASGEAAIGMIGVAEGRKRASVAIVIDVSGRLEEARALVNKIDAEMQRREATSEGEIEGGSVKVYTIPAYTNERGKRIPEWTSACFIFADRLVASDDPGIARSIAERLQGKQQGAVLEGQADYQATMKRVQEAAGQGTPTLRWYISPFAYDLAARTLETSDGLPDKKDSVTIMREQGFDAVRGVGGYVIFAADALRDFVHHTVVYAPPKPGKEKSPAAEKYDLSMRMFDLPNTNGPYKAEPWAPREVASYKTVNLNIQNAFDHVGPLFDAFAGYDNAFETTLEGFEKDPHGPKINLRSEIVEYFGSRVTIMTDYTLPITEDCERYLIVIDITDPEKLREPLDKLLESDGAQAKEIQGVPYWEIVPEEEAFADADLDAGLLPLDDTFESYDEPDEERVLRRAAVCLHEGKLAIGSDVEFLRKALFGIKEHESLEQSPELKASLETLSELTTSDRCSWAFTRLDESIRPTYELLRQGKMPQAQTFFGRFLNRYLTTADEAKAGADRKQRIDGNQLPSFELARRYFGPAARTVRSVEDGWVMSGVIMSKATE